MILFKLLKRIFYLSFKIPIPQKFIKIIEKWILIYQGKGWGSETVKEEVDICLLLLRKKPTIFIDVGANKGEYTKYIKSKLKNIQCHLFEPSETNFLFLKKIFFNFDDVNINNLGLSDSNSIADLYFNKAGSGLASLTKRKLDHFNIKFDKSEKVNLVRFDNYWLDENLIIDFVKIDVEGHELDVLKGFGKFINRTKLIQFEFGGCNIDTKTFFQDFWYFFTEKGFLLYRINPRGYSIIPIYSEEEEFFQTTNFIAVNKSLNK